MKTVLLQQLMRERLGQFDATVFKLLYALDKAGRKLECSHPNVRTSLGYITYTAFERAAEKLERAGLMCIERDKQGRIITLQAILK